MSNVVPISKPFSADDIPVTLRRIADEIEADEHGLMTTCLVVLGHTGEQVVEGGDKMQQSRYRLFGCGPRCDTFTTRGLLLTVATQELGDG